MLNTFMLSVKNLFKRFPVEGSFFRTKGFVEAVKNVSLEVGPDEIVALVGESGSGKTTVGKLIQGLAVPDSGEILFNGIRAESLSRKKRAAEVQMIFQDPFSSLNPKLSVGTMLREALMLAENPEEPLALLDSVGLPPDILHDYPHQFSGGQRQRLGIARALAMRPRLVIADEPVSALDVSISAQILNLLLDLKAKTRISYLLITHDLSVVQSMADRILVMKDGEIVEEGSVASVYGSPKNSYTQTLLAAIPRITI